MHELLFQVIIYCFAALALFAAVLTIAQSNPVRSVLFLVLTFFASAGIWMMLSAEFLSLILILVYVGAVMTLFLFVVMMLNIDIESRKIHFMKYTPFGLVIMALLFGLLYASLPKDWFVESSENPASVFHPATAHDFVTPLKPVTNTEDLGMVLYTQYFLAFEVAAVLLLVSIISAITLVHRNAKRCKRQSIVEQVMTDPKERLTLIKMNSEKP